MSDYAGRVVVYDHERDGDRAGVCVEPRCPTCRRFVGARDTAVFYDGWREGVHHFTGWRCPRRGPFQPHVVCWAVTTLRYSNVRAVNT